MAQKKITGDQIEQSTLNPDLFLPTQTGNAGEFLTTDGTNVSWAPGGSSSPLTTKGDLYTYSTVNARLGVGTNGQVLTADSAEATGLKWAAASAAAAGSTGQLQYNNAGALGASSAFTVTESGSYGALKLLNEYGSTVEIAGDENFLKFNNFARNMGFPPHLKYYDYAGQLRLSGGYKDWQSNALYISTETEPLSGEAASMYFEVGSQTYGEGMVFNVNGSQRLALAKDGQFAVNGSYGIAGQVLTSGGDSAAAGWTTPAGGSNWLKANNGSNFGTAPTTTGSNSISLGNAATNTGTNSISVGTSATTGSAASSIAIGNGATNNAANSISIGNSAGSGIGAVGIGYQTNGGAPTAGTNGVAIGYQASAGTAATKTGNIGVGYQADSGGGGSASYNIVVGYATQAGNVSNGQKNIAIGANSYANSVFGTITIGSNSGGQSNAFATSLGGYLNNIKTGETAFGHQNFSATGDAYSSVYLARVQTSNATPTEVGLNSTSPQTTTINTYYVMDFDTSMGFDCDIVARNTDNSNTDTSFWNLKFCIKKDATAASTALVGLVTKTIVGQDAAASTWDVTVTADTTNGRPKIEVTGESGKTIKWLCNARITKLTA